MNSICAKLNHERLFLKVWLKILPDTVQYVQYKVSFSVDNCSSSGWRFSAREFVQQRSIIHRSDSKFSFFLFNAETSIFFFISCQIKRHSRTGHLARKL